MALDPLLPQNPPFIPVIPAISSKPLPVPVQANPLPSVLSNYAKPAAPYQQSTSVPYPNNPAKPTRA